MKKTGTIQALNLSPKGFHEGFVLKTHKRIVQINLRKKDRRSLGDDLKPGERITVDVEKQEPRGKPVHEVYDLVRLRRSDGDSKSRKHRICGFYGVVKTLNYALHGAVNGAMLDSGDFLHLKPAEARRLKLTVGLPVEAKGKNRLMVDGHSAIEAEQVNGIEIQRHNANKHAAKRAKH